MPWAKIDDRFYDHPKTVSVGTLGAGLFSLALSYTSNKLTDGFIAAPMIRRLVADVDDPMALAEELVKAGFFERVKGGYQIHDYLDYNPPATKVIAEREAAKERMRLAREKHEPGDTYECSGELPANFDDGSPCPMPVSHDPLPITMIPESSSFGAGAPPASNDKKPVQPYSPIERHIMALWDAKRLNSSQRELLAGYEKEYTYQRIVEVSKWCHVEKMALGHAINAMRSALKNWDKPKAGGTNAKHRRSDNGDDRPDQPPLDLETANRVRALHGLPPITSLD